MLGKKKKKKDEALESRISETAFRVVLNALKQILETEVKDEDENFDTEMTIKAIKQQAQMTLDFVESLNSDEDEEPPKQIKEQKFYVKR